MSGGNSWYAGVNMVDSMRDSGVGDSAKRLNRLAAESSPYLRQHAGNPVDWYPWKAEALGRARKENRPIFLSIGYSACHWCHVMERESFENPAIAEVLNRHFISIKVDREELPDVDEVYMDAVQLLTGGGGWPLSVFLTPDLQPFYGGTYFPPESRMGLPGFRDLLLQIAHLWQTDRFRALQGAAQLTGALQEHFGRIGSAGPIGGEMVEEAARALEGDFDWAWGGFGGAPKFPPAGAIGFLFRHCYRTGSGRSLEMGVKTLDGMMRGGMYDQIGGGFHRYSTDGRWLVPHFEKMLYDNALLSRAYLDGWLATGNGAFRQVAAETLDYVVREMEDPGGGFHCAEDADSEGEEGRYYVWGRDEISGILGEEDGDLFCAYYGVTAGGNFEGRNILHRPRTDEEFARERGLDARELQGVLGPMRERLRLERDKRVHPARDNKILSGWNGMMISALARGAQALGEKRYREAAERAAGRVLGARRDGRLRHVAGPTAGDTAGYLDDYGHVILGLADLYETSFAEEHLDAARELCEVMIGDFRDPGDGAFFSTGPDHAKLPARTKPFFDGAVPAGNAVAALALLRLRWLLDHGPYEEMARGILSANTALVGRAPRAFLNLFEAAEQILYPVTEIAIAGPRGDGQTEALLGAAWGAYVPHRCIGWIDPQGADGERRQRQVPWLRGKALVEGRPTGYVCRNFACGRPVSTAEALVKELAAGRVGARPERGRAAKDGDE